MENREQDREQLRSIQAIFEEALKNNSIEDIRPYTHKDFSFVSFTDRSFKDFDSFAKQWGLTRQEMLGQKGTFSSQLNPEPSFFYDDIAICHGCASSQMKDKKGKDFKYTSNRTVVCKKEQGAWKVVRAHNSLNPFSNPMLVSGVKSRIIGAVLVALILGIILGAIVCKFI